MSKTLPKGWIEIPLNHVADNKSGNSKIIKGKLHKEQSGNLFPAFSATGQDVFFDSYENEGNALILSAVGARCGKVFKASGKWSAIANTHIVWPNNNFLDHQYFWYLINNEDFWIKGGSAQPFVKVSATFERLQPLPPLNEQKRIVAKLDAIMPRIEAVKERLDRVPGILKRFRQSVLTAAVTGKLTEQWREEHPEVDVWENVKLIDIINDKPRNGYSPIAVKYETPVKSLTLTATTSGKFNSSCYKFIDEVIPIDSHLWLKKDDILIQRSNSINYVGISAIYPGNDFEFIYPDLIMKVKANKEMVYPSFLILALQCHQTLDYFRKNATGTAGSMPKINQSTVMNAPIQLPPLEEQKEIVRQVDKLFALADKVEAHYQKAKARVDKLSQSVLAKAFRGELVSQDPNDEPAEKLLERILEEKAKMEAALKGAKIRGTKKTVKKKSGSKK